MMRFKREVSSPPVRVCLMEGRVMRLDCPVGLSPSVTSVSSLNFLTSDVTAFGSAANAADVAGLGSVAIADAMAVLLSLAIGTDAGCRAAASATTGAACRRFSPLALSANVAMLGRKS